MHRVVDSRNKEKLKGATFSLVWVGDSDLVSKITKIGRALYRPVLSYCCKKNPSCSLITANFSYRCFEIVSFAFVASAMTGTKRTNIERAR